MSGWISWVALMQEGHIPHESISDFSPDSDRDRISDCEDSTANNELLFAESKPPLGGLGVQVIYCASAKARESAPLPSLLKKSNAWLRRLC